MKRTKIGTIFLVSMLALAGVGISYAGLTDTISIYGTVTTGTVDLTIEEYSGTWVWKVYNDPDEIVITHDPTYSVDLADGMLVSYAKGRDVEDTDPPGYDAVLDFHNLFPCIDFMADIVFHYEGSIPAKITEIDYDWQGDMIDTDGDEIPDTDFIEHLMSIGDQTNGEFGLTYSLMKYNEDTTEFDIPVDEGFQLHFCDLVKLIVTIHLPQDNKYQDLAGTGFVKIDLLQWNDLCDVEEFPDIKITKIVDNNNPYPGEIITFTVTAENLGPGDATSVIVQDILPDSLVLQSAIPSAGTYVAGVWNIGPMAAGQMETLVLEVLVDVPTGTGGGFTQFALILDGSNSIPPGDWTIMKTGIATALADPDCFPQDGSVELTVIQFGTDLYCARVELPPTVITGANVAGVAATISGMTQGHGWTPMGAGIYLAAKQLHDVGDFDSSYRQVINLVTDGVPNVVSGPDDLCGPGSTTTAQGKICAKNARDYLLGLLEMTDVQDEFDAEAVGYGTDVSWLRDNIVWPQPGYDNWPPTGSGWVRYVDSYTEFSDTICEKFTVLFESPENVATLIECIPDDSNPDNNEAKVTIIVKPCQKPEFTNIDLEYSTDETTWYDVTKTATGFQLDIDISNNHYYLTLGTATTTNPPLKDGYYGFLLDTTSLPADFYTYWAGRGVTSSATDWQGHMWNIINGIEPMFYVKVSGNGGQYMLVDGLHYDFFLQEKYLRLDGDYPLGTYYFKGKVTAVCGLESDEITVEIEFI